MTLDLYHSKRKFSETPEPRQKKVKKSGARPQTLRFVIQKHAARRLHYDFRLELNGSLKSWAVPKGPSLDPTEKRMAVHVEDHPISYADFEGTIPPGNYGAGTVIVWDKGEWIPLGNAEEDYAKGRLKFELRGEKLQGKWDLVRMHTRNEARESWLLIKSRDDQARPASEYNIVEAMPDSVLTGTISDNLKAKSRSAFAQKSKLAKQNSAVTADRLGKKAPQALTQAPQLATLVDSPPKDSGWLYEVKFDGYRILARITAEGVHLFTRNGHDWSKKLSHLAHSIEAMALPSAWLDGEIVMLNETGIQDFQALQNAFEAGRTQSIRYFVFDLLYYNGRDLRTVPLKQRRDLLQRIIEQHPAELVQFSESFSAPSSELLTTACQMKLEGLIAKRADAPYTEGRTRDWVKLKCIQRQEFVIGGFTDSRAAGNRAIGALLLGVYEKNGQLRYAGKVGTGFTQESLAALKEKLNQLIIEKSPFTIFSGRKEPAHWVKPALVAEVVFAEWTRDGHIRHSSFQGLRSDKSAKTITQETAQANESKPPEPDARVAPAKMNRTNKSKLSNIKISHPDRVIDEKSGITKAELADFYATLAPFLLGETAQRPTSLVRAPEGVGGEIFFQKHKGTLEIPQLRELDPSLMPGHAPLITVDSHEALLNCIQMNVVEFHNWNARINAIEKPDRIIFDLDPGENIQWPQLVKATELMKGMLDEISLKSFLKTSGGKGLHVVVPLTPKDGWDTVKGFSAALVHHMAAVLPQLFVAKSGPKNRVGRIFIDYLRNGRGSTTVTAFSARLRPGLPVSVPVAWEELPHLKSSQQWHIRNLDAKIAQERLDCWSHYSKTRQTLSKAMKKIDFDPT